MCAWRNVDSLTQHAIVDAVNQHKEQCKTWNYGRIQKYWLDKDMDNQTILCIQYENGTTFRYHRNGKEMSLCG
ncbi:hypothetical protein [Butyrivibrio sp. NC3005]|uniref:hypothetical protein n=1 Tax=Butyrivibrio sp. NC3005 TaxID=1280685 RepID=UPI0004209AD3|nr:hypothetical protein [Butyrivibrio sp. NC3005]